jgi:hypothetical protein
MPVEGTQELGRQAPVITTRDTLEAANIDPAWLSLIDGDAPAARRKGRQVRPRCLSVVKTRLCRLFSQLLPTHDEVNC